MIDFDGKHALLFPKEIVKISQRLFWAIKLSCGVELDLRLRTLNRDLFLFYVYRMPATWWLLTSPDRPGPGATTSSVSWDRYLSLPPPPTQPPSLFPIRMVFMWREQVSFGTYPDPTLIPE
jgi:hypothetical protein